MDFYKTTRVKIQIIVVLFFPPPYILHFNLFFGQDFFSI